MAQVGGARGAMATCITGCSVCHRDRGDRLGPVSALVQPLSQSVCTFLTSGV